MYHEQLLHVWSWFCVYKLKSIYIINHNFILSNIYYLDDKYTCTLVIVLRVPKILGNTVLCFWLLMWKNSRKAHLVWNYFCCYFCGSSSLNLLVKNNLGDFSCKCVSIWFFAFKIYWTKLTVVMIITSTIPMFFFNFCHRFWIG